MVPGVGDERSLGKIVLFSEAVRVRQSLVLETALWEDDEPLAMTDACGAKVLLHKMTKPLISVLA